MNLDTLRAIANDLLILQQELKELAYGNNEQAFVLGDFVRATNDMPKGESGTVLAFHGGLVGVEFPGFTLGHVLDGEASDGHGWWCRPEDLERIA